LVEKKTLGIVAVFVAILIGASLMIPLGNKTRDIVNTRTTLNETVAISGGVGNAANDDIISTTYFGNSTISTDTTGIDFDEEVNVTVANGSIRVNTINFSDGNYKLSYSFYPDDYVKNNASRSLTNLVVVFFVILLIAVAFIGIKKSGLLDAT
jgi:hypothetical protein